MIRRPPGATLTDTRFPYSPLFRAEGVLRVGSQARHPRVQQLSMAEPDQAQQRLVRVAARALARHGLVHAYGHCSLRLDEGHFLVAPSKQLGLVAADAACTVVPIDVPLPDGFLDRTRVV